MDDRIHVLIIKRHRICMNDILYKSMKVTIMESIISKAAMKERDINRYFDIIFLRRLDIKTFILEYIRRVVILLSILISHGFLVCFNLFIQR